MGLILFVAIIAFGGIIAGVFLGGYMAEREARKGDQKGASTKPVDAASAQGREKRRFWFGSSNQPDQALQFQSWASANFTDASLRTWIASLTKEQIHALNDQLAAFCTNLGFELKWLTDERLRSHANLEPMAAMIVEHYCTACYEATMVQRDFEQFKKAHELIEQPFSREHKPITQKLFAELVRRNAAPPLSPDLMVANENERQQQIARELKEASSNNWPVFIEAFYDATAGDGASKPKASERLVSTLRHPFGSRRTPSSSTGDIVTPNVVSPANASNGHS